MKARSWAALAVGLVVCVVASYAAYMMADYSWNQVVDYRGPYAASGLPAGGLADAFSPEASGTLKGEPGRMVYVIIDGLREDVSRKMPALNNLRAHGFDAVVRTSQPSLSFPNWTTLLSGAPQRFSGVTTNWFEERVPVETIVDTALTAGRTVAVSAPTDFEMLYGVERTGHVFLRDWESGTYMTAGIVDNAIRLARETSASLLIVHLPDIDEAGHASGGASKEYLDTAIRVDGDLGRLVTALQGPYTTFVVASDHGHIDTGGHGGPEDVVIRVPAVFAGSGVRPGAGEGTQDQVAPTVAMLGYLPAPRNATGEPLDLSAATDPASTVRFAAQQVAAYAAYAAAVEGPGVRPDTKLLTVQGARAEFELATTTRLASERVSRMPASLALAAVCLLAILAVGMLSWRALVAALSGTVMYYVVYEGLFFVLHGYRWSLSSFNSEALLKAFLNGRMIDAVIAGVFAAAVAADIYLVTRKAPQRPKGEYLPGWLSLGVATVLVIQATIGIQVAWYLWQWGASVSWYIPDLALGFKYDLDLVQITGLAVAALLAPVVTYLVGRYHPIRSPKGA
ncbi:MAG TPA: alkaline phosphatase family protein [Coriobacteriia bacterium]